MVKSSAKPEKDGSPSQNPSNVSETKFPVINKFLINSIAKFTICDGYHLLQFLMNSSPIHPVVKLLENIHIVLVVKRVNDCNKFVTIFPYEIFFRCKRFFKKIFRGYDFRLKLVYI